MIVTETPDKYRFITQPNHATLAGQFAIHWGNDKFDRLAPYHALCIAAELHDYGWIEYDLHPRLTDGSVERFDGVGPSEDVWIDFYSQGVRNVAKIDTYAGLLASMHASGLRRQQYGIWTPDDTIAPDSGFEQFVTNQESFQRKLLAELKSSTRYADFVTERDRDLLATLHENGTPDESYTDSRLWENFLLLETVDDLSLYVCTNSVFNSDSIGSPIDSTGNVVALATEPADSSKIRIEPYPFDTVPFTVSVEARTISAGYATEANLIKAYYETDCHDVEVTFQR